MEPQREKPSAYREDLPRKQSDCTDEGESNLGQKG